MKLSDEGAGYLFPKTPPEDLLDRLLAGGAGVAVITRGAEGAYLASGGDRIDISAVETRVADTVGAGGSFIAALIWSLVFGEERWDGGPVTVTRLNAVGNRAAGITVSGPGGDLPYLRDLQAATPRSDAES